VVMFDKHLVSWTLPPVRGHQSLRYPRQDGHHNSAEKLRLESF
jgi:hypothetical protein